MKNIFTTLLMLLLATVNILNIHAHKPISLLNEPQGAFALVARAQQEQPPFPTPLRRVNAFMGDLPELYSVHGVIPESTANFIRNIIAGLATAQRLEPAPQDQQNGLHEESSCATARPFRANPHPQR